MNRWYIWVSAAMVLSAWIIAREIPKPPRYQAVQVGTGIVFFYDTKEPVFACPLINGAMGAGWVHMNRTQQSIEDEQALADYISKHSKPSLKDALNAISKDL